MPAELPQDVYLGVMVVEYIKTLLVMWERHRAFIREFLASNHHCLDMETEDLERLALVIADLVSVGGDWQGRLTAPPPLDAHTSATPSTTRTSPAVTSPSLHEPSLRRARPSQARGRRHGGEARRVKASPLRYTDYHLSQAKALVDRVQGRSKPTKTERDALVNKLREAFHRPLEIEDLLLMARMSSRQLNRLIKGGLLREDKLVVMALQDIKK